MTATPSTMPFVDAIAYRTTYEGKIVAVTNGRMPYDPPPPPPPPRAVYAAVQQA